jgi:hypothetical protein
LRTVVDGDLHPRPRLVIDQLIWFARRCGWICGSHAKLMFLAIALHP